MPKLKESCALAVDIAAVLMANTANKERRIFIFSSIKKMLSLCLKRKQQQKVYLTAITNNTRISPCDAYLKQQFME
jgi:hypothetical protein